MRFIRAAVGIAVLLVAPALANAQGVYPNKPVRLIVAYAAGGVADVIARVIAAPLGAELGQNFVVDNRAGAGGAIGTQACVKATPDGYTLCMGSQSSVILNPMLLKDANYDAQKSFTPITLIAYVPNVLVVSPKINVRTVDDLIKWLKGNPGAAWGTSGVGTSNHLTSVYLNNKYGFKIEHVPYKGGILAIQEVLANQISMAMDQISSSIGHIRNKTLIPIAQSGAIRSVYLPNVPTFAETIFPEFRFDSFQGLFGPAGLPPAVSTRLSDAIHKIITTRADVRDNFVELGGVAVANSPAEFAAQIRDQVPLFRELVQASGIKSQ